MNDLEEAVRDAFATLIDQGKLRIESSEYVSTDFGNAAVIVAGTNVLVRLVRDRDQTFADAAARTRAAEWAPLERAAAAVTGSQAALEGLLTPDEAAEIVARSLDQLERGYSAENVAETLRRIAALGEQSQVRVTQRLFRRQH